MKDFLYILAAIVAILRNPKEFEKLTKDQSGVYTSAIQELTKAEKQ